MMGLVERIRDYLELKRTEAMFEGFDALNVLVTGAMIVKKDLPGESSFFIRMNLALANQEFQLALDDSASEFEKGVVVKLRTYRGFEDQGYAIVFTFNHQWLDRMAREKLPGEFYDTTYQGLKKALRFREILAKRGYHLLTTPECKEIKRGQELLQKGKQ
jgi:hypothetical protein